MLLIQDPETNIAINLDNAGVLTEDTDKGGVVARFPGGRYVLIRGLTFNLLEIYTVERNGRFKLHKVEPLNFTKW